MQVTEKLIRRLIEKAAKRGKHIGCYDFCRGSYDWQKAEERAYRIARRMNRM